jgi:hypothetical protein
LVIELSEHQTTFRWYRDAAGYDLSADQRTVMRRGGRMIEYDPATVAKPFLLHRTFVNLFPLSFLNDLGLEFGKGLVQIYEPLPDGFRPEEALLKFVTAYGFLGSDRSGADAEQEAVDYLVKVWRDIAGLYHLGKIFDDAALSLADGQYTGPNLRMCLEKDDSGRIQVRYRPESLHAWLWLRIAEDLTSGVRWDGMPCLFCCAPIGRGPGGHRTDAKFCGDDHRVYFYRLSPAEKKKRRAEARQFARSQQEAST